MLRSVNSVNSGSVRKLFSETVTECVNSVDSGSVRKLFLNVDCGGSSFDALIDTGATVSCISAELFEEPQKTLILQKFKAKEIRGASGSTVAVTFGTEIPIVLGSSFSLLEVEVVEGLPCAMLLGMNFLGSAKVKGISTTKMKLFLANESLDLFPNSDGKSTRECNNIFLIQGKLKPNQIYDISKVKRTEGTASATGKLQKDLDKTLNILKQFVCSR